MLSKQSKKEHMEFTWFGRCDIRPQIKTIDILYYSLNSTARKVIHWKTWLWTLITEYPNNY